MNLIAAALSIILCQPVPSPQTDVVRRTVSALTWYVDGRGNDLNTCTSQFTDGGRVGPCLTTQGATNRVPKFLRHGSIVRHAAMVDGGPQNYPCFYVSGFQDELTADGGGLLFDGPLVNFSTDGGVLAATGTIGAVGTSGNHSWFSIVDGTQIHADNALRGYLLEVTSGTGVGGVHVIDSNDGGTMAITGVSTATGATAPVAGSGYAIRQPGWVVNTACAVPGTFGVAATATNAGVIVADNSLGWNRGAITFKNMGATLASGAGVAVGGVGTQVQLENARFVLTSGPGVTTLEGTLPRPHAPAISVRKASFTTGTANYGVSLTGAGEASLVSVLSYGSNAGLLRTRAFGNSGSASVSNSHAVNATVAGMSLPVVEHSSADVQQSVFDCASTAGYGMIFGVSGAVGVTSLSGDRHGFATFNVLNNTVMPSCGVGVAAAGPGAIITTTTFGAGSAGATTGYAASWGARIMHVAGTRLTGGTQDVLLDNTWVAAGTDIAVGGCQISDGGESLYGSRFCR